MYAETTSLQSSWESFANRARRDGVRLCRQIIRFGALAYRLGRLWAAAALTGELTPQTFSRAARRYARALVESVGIKVEARGILPSDGRSVLVVANHISWFSGVR